MWGLAASMIGLITLQAIDDVLEGRPATHTWAASLGLIAAVTVLIAAAVAIGKLLA